MASIIIVGVLLLLHRPHRTFASPVDYSQRSYGTCKQFDIPVIATAPSAVYDIPRVDNDLEATAWAIFGTTRTTPQGIESIIKNTTTSGVFNIHSQLCIPKSSKKRDLLQIATHGVGYDLRYWDSKYQPEKHSQVDATLKAGYSIFTYDRLGVGQSDKPDAYTVVQAPLEQEILRQLTLMARNGNLYNLASKADPTTAPEFKALPKPRKVIHVGHSFGSSLTTSFIANYGSLSDGAIITGFLQNPFFGTVGFTSFSVEYAATSNPPFERSSGYVVSKKNGVQNIFFGGDPKTAFTPELLDYGNEIKQPCPIGEFASAFWLSGKPATAFKAPIQYFLPEQDFFGCRGDCNNLANMTELRASYPSATDIEVAIQPNTGHALPLHNNATAGFQVMFDFLNRNGL